MMKSSTKQLRSTKRSTCRHEAGHCVAAVALGFRQIIDGEVWKNRRKWGGQVRFEIIEDKPLVKETALIGLRVVIAGVLATYPNLDASEIESVLPQSDLVPFQWSLPIASHGDEKWSVLESAVNETKQMLTNHNEALEGIAAVLFRKNKISGDEVERIVDAKSSSLSP